jgi:hypothetical protein
MATHIVRELQVQMRKIAQMIEKCGPLPAHLERRGAGQCQDHRKIMRREIPQRIVLSVELAKAKAVRMNITHLAKLARLHQFEKLLKSRMETQHMADHEHTAIVARRLHFGFRIGNRQRDRLFNQHILAVGDGADRKISMILRRQRQNDGIHILAREKILDLDMQHAMLRREARGAVTVLV